MKLPFFQRKKEEKLAVPTRFGEISFRDPMLYPRGSMWAPYNPDVFVMRKGGLEIYDKMRRDEQVKACQYIKRLSVLCSGWDVESASDQPQDEEAADFCRYVLEKLKGTLEDNLKQILTALDYGFSVTEKVWGLVDNGEFRGKVGLTALKTRKPHRWDFETDEYGNLKPDGLWQGQGQHKYSPQKFIIYTHNKEFDNWYGQSDLQAAYRAWWSKDVIIKFWNIYLEKFGMGIPWLHPAEGKALLDPVFSELKTALSNLQNGSMIGTTSSDAVIDILEAKRRGAGEYDAAIKYHDRSIARALLMPMGVGFSEDEQKGGSYARSQTHFNVWLWIMSDLRKTVEETVMNEQVIPELVDYNYQVEGYPRFKFMPLEEPEVLKLGELWLKAVQGKAVHTDAEDELHFRKLIKFPERDREELEEEIEAKKAEPPPQLPQPPPPQLPEKIELQNQEYARRWHRDLTKYEKRVDFAAVERSLDDAEEDARRRLIGVFQKQRDKVLLMVEKAADKINQKWINSLALPYGVAIQAIVKDTLRTTYELGRRDASSEISRARQKQHSYVIKIPPKKTIEQLEKWAFFISGDAIGTVRKEIRNLLLSMLETGEGVQETLMKIRHAFDPYVGDEQIIRDQRQIEPYRIETIIRTNVTKAYNWGKIAEFADPELQGFVRAVQFSAILDSRTTNICRSADGKIFMLDDPILKRFIPPLHFQCRSLFASITEADGQFEPSKQSELNEILSKVSPSFGGNVDK